MRGIHLGHGPSTTTPGGPPGSGTGTSFQVIDDVLYLVDRASGIAYECPVTFVGPTSLPSGVVTAGPDLLYFHYQGGTWQSPATVLTSGSTLTPGSSVVANDTYYHNISGSTYSIPVTRSVDSPGGTAPVEMAIVTVDGVEYVRVTFPDGEVRYEQMSETPTPDGTGGGGTPPSDLPYDATLWDGNLAPATKNALRDKFESLPVATPPSDVAYDATTWNDNLSAATKNVLRDKFESLPAPPAGANPSVTVGLTPTNGAAATFMRSDAAPALSASISPTWSGTHSFNNPVTVPDEAYNAGTWDGALTVPTKNAVRDKFVAVEATIVPSAATLSGYLTSNVGPTTSATAVNVTGMSFAIAAGEIWGFQFYVILTVSAAGGSTKFAIDVPTSATFTALIRGASGSAVISVDSTLHTTGVSNTAPGSAIISGVVNNTAGSAGTVQLMYASGDGIASTTVTGLGSYFIARKLN